ncbi:MAG: hypothetical protein R2852_06740 [Bacteroidia bacterium]
MHYFYPIHSERSKWHTSPSELLYRMKYEYTVYWDSNRLKRADSCGLNAIEVNTLQHCCKGNKQIR